MSTVTLSSKNQITLPVEMVRSLGLKAGDKLHVIQTGDHLALFPRPANLVSSLVGSMKGYWGSKADIDRYVAQERQSWREGEEEKERLKELLAADPVAERLYATLRERPRGYDALRKATGLGAAPLDRALEALGKLGAVSEVPLPDAPQRGDRTIYRVTSRGSG